MDYSAQEVAKEKGIPYARVYSTLERLVKDGWLTSNLGHRPRLYRKSNLAWEKFFFNRIERTRDLSQRIMAWWREGTC